MPAEHESNIVSFLSTCNYYAVACEALRSQDFAGMSWKIQSLSWQQVSNRIENEEALLAAWDERLAKSDRGIAPPLTPTLDEISRAASILYTTKNLLIFEIKQYANRNGYCHSG